METNMVPNKEKLQRWITVYLATIVGEPSESIDPDGFLSEFDLDSIDAVTMSLDMEKAFGIRVHPETFLMGSASINNVVERFCGDEAISAVA